MLNIKIEKPDEKSPYELNYKDLTVGVYENEVAYCIIANDGVDGLYYLIILKSNNCIYINKLHNIRDKTYFYWKKSDVKLSFFS